MNRMSFMLAVLAMLLLIPASAEQTSTKQTNPSPPTAESVRSGKRWTKDPLVTYEPGNVPQFPDGVFDLYMFPGWYEPDQGCHSYKGEMRLVIRLVDGKGILNPKGYSSQTIPLEGLSFENAEMLWGKARKGFDGTKTFDLISKYRTAEKDIYHVDMKFTDEKLGSYRVRGIGIPNPQWISID